MRSGTSNITVCMDSPFLAPGPVVEPLLVEVFDAEADSRSCACCRQPCLMSIVDISMSERVDWKRLSWGRSGLPRPDPLSTRCWRTTD